jgi:hypothetical protein
VRTPVTRSPKRMPQAMIRSDFWMALLTQASPCMPIMPSESLVRGGEGAKAQQRRSHGNLQPLGQRADLVHRIGFHNAVPGQDDRALGRDGKIKIRQALLRILGDVHKDRTGAAGTGNQEGLAQHRGDLLRACHAVVVLGDGQRNPVMSTSWKASLPSSLEETWPVMQTMGTESIMAVAMPVTRLVAAGPEVAIATPT